MNHYIYNRELDEANFAWVLRANSLVKRASLLGDRCKADAKKHGLSLKDYSNRRYGE